MKRLLLTGLPLLLLGVALSEVRADIAPRFPPNQPVNPFGPGVPPGLRMPQAQKVNLVVEVDEKAREARLRIPVNLLVPNAGMAPGQPQQRPPFFPGALLPWGGDGGRHLPTIIAGLALALSAASAGLWLARRGWRRSLAFLVVLSLFAIGTTAVWADLGPRPFGPRPRPPVPAPQPALPQLKLPAGIELSDKITVEIVPPARQVTLIVPKGKVLDKDKVPGAKRGE